MHTGHRTCRSTYGLRVLREIFVVVVLAGVACSDLPPCPHQSDQTLYARVAWDSKDAKESGTGWKGNFPLTGTVIENGSGYLPTTAVTIHSLETGTKGPAGSVWFRVRSASGDEILMSFEIESGRAPAVDTEVVIESASDWVFSEYLVTAISLRRATGELLFWAVDSVWLSDVDPPEGFELRLGSAVCESSDQGGSWSGTKLSATYAGKSVQVPYGGSTLLGDFRIVNARLFVETDHSGHVADWERGRVVLGVINADDAVWIP